MPADPVSRETPPLSGARVSRETGERLELFVSLIDQWSQTINLVGPLDREAIWHRHVDESLAILPHLPAGKDVVDFGSGAGFPGVVLAIASGRTVHLVEADQRKAAFLRAVAGATGARAVVHATRIERLSLAPIDCLTARALAPLPRLLQLSHPHLSPTGTALFPKGARVEEEIDAASRHWRMEIERVSLSTGGMLLKVSRLESR